MTAALAEPGPFIAAKSLGKQVSLPDRNLVILDDISFSVEAGESMAIVGASGSGKSTLLGLLAGLDMPSQGQIWLDGKELTALDEDGRAALRATTVGFVFQSFQLLPSMTALENVMLPLELTSRPSAVTHAKDILERVGLDERLHHYPKQLSGGEQQRVAIARAFAAAPKVLFADEPTGNLDRDTGEVVRDLLFSLNRERSTTLVLVTHDARLADHCNRRIELDGGRLRA